MEALAKKLGERLRASKAMLVTAESCTGGWVAQVVTSVPGSSEWFERGFVSYSNAAKQDLLGVRAETLARHGAVSEETAREMALGALARAKGTHALAITGVAGPTGGSRDKPAISVLHPDMDKITTLAAYYQYGPPGNPWPTPAAQTATRSAPK